LSDILRATDWVSSHRAPGAPAVVNMSFGVSAAVMGNDTSLDTAIQSLVNSGITVVAAAGNNGGNACQEDPARVPDVITAAAVASNRTEASWSNYGSCVDLFAPGSAVKAAGLDPLNSTPGTTYYAESGTSFSAPLVAAAAAQALHDVPAWTPAQVASDLVARADPGVVTGPSGGAPRSVNELLNVSTQFSGTAPTISGARFAGQTLKASLHWFPAPASTAYQWLRNGTPIPNATSASYVPTTSDVGQSITVSATGSRTRLADVTGTSQAVVPAAAPRPGTVVTMSPVRLMDTRTGLGATGPVRNGQVVKLPIAGVADMMSSVSAVLVNITVTDATSAGFVTAYASGGAMPPTSNANFVAGSTSANLALVPVGSDGAIALSLAATSAQLVVDVQSYIAGGTVSDAGAVKPVTPARLLDTRSWPTAVRPWQSVPVQVTGSHDVPSDATAVFLNVTVTEPQASGYLTAYPTGESVPATSNLNFLAGQTVPNMVLVKVGAGGSISIFNANAGTAQIVVDVEGYVTAGTASVPGSVVPVSPVRVVDTRIGLAGTGPVAAWGTVVVTIGGGSAPPTPHGVFMNLTVTEPQAAGWVSAYPTQSSPPLVSNVNYVPGQTVPNLATVGLASSKATLLNGSSKTVQLVADIFGYIL
jgi:Subtilase family